MTLSYSPFIPLYLETRAILQYLDDQVEANEMKYGFMDGDHELFKKGIVEHWCEDGIANSEAIALTAKGRKLLLAGMKPGKKHEVENDEEELIESNCLKLIEVADITPQELYYDSEVNHLVSDLSKFFEQENYNAILERMKQLNFRSAFTCLFYGGPGTGKTETVNQLARITGRDILLVDVPQIKDKWVGESEKNVLADYRELNQLRGDYESLTDSSHQQDYAYRQLLDQLSVPSLRVQVLAIADALIGGRPIPSSGGGGGTTSDLRWDGRNPDEEEDAYRRRCLLQASKMVGNNGVKRKR